MIRLLILFVFLVLSFTGKSWAAEIDASDVLAAIKQVESNGNPFAIRDNTGNRSYFPKSLAEAVSKAKELLTLGHNIDMGLYQINSYHLKGGLSADNIFNAATQARTAEKIFNDFYTRAKAIYGDTELAIWRATGAYNAGNAALYRDNAPYVSKVLAALGLSPARGKRGGWSQADASPNSTTSMGRSHDIVMPSQWQIGTDIDGESEDQIESGNAEEKIAAIIVIIIVTLLMILMLKIGAIWWVAKWLVKRAIAVALRQMTKRRTITT